MSFTLGEAARATGKSKPTITRAIRTGRLSATRGANGVYQIDPAELSRVYPLVTGDTGTPGGSVVSPSASPESHLIREIEHLRETVEDLRRRLDASEAERRQFAYSLLPDQRPWWRRWWGGEE